MRKLRELKVGASYHVISRANRKEMIFNSDEVKEMFMEFIRKAKIKYSFIVQNFCIMGNHYHLIIKPLKSESLSKIMQWILGNFAKMFNKKFGLSGHVWCDRFISRIIRSIRQYVTTFLYICRNPVRAEITKSAMEYKYNGISFLQKGLLDILERPPNPMLRQMWTQLRKD